MNLASGLEILWGVVGTMLLVAVMFAFTALYLRYQNYRNEQRWRALESRWKPILLDVLSARRSPETLWEAVNEAERLHFVDYLLRYARRVRGSTRETLCELARPYLSPIMERAQHGDPERRARAVETLGILGTREHMPVVVAALDDPAPLVSMLAARALARSSEPAHADAVLERLHSYEYWNAAHLISMLASMPYDVAPKLRELLLDADQPSHTRAIAAGALTKLCDPDAADLAAGIIGERGDRDLVAACLRLLCVVGRPEHRTAVRQVCGSEDPVLRAHALRTLAVIGATEDLERLYAGLNDPSRWVAIQSARGLKDMGQVDTLVDLISAGNPRADLARQILMECRS